MRCTESDNHHEVVRYNFLDCVRALFPSLFPLSLSLPASLSPLFTLSPISIALALSPLSLPLSLYASVLPPHALSPTLSLSLSLPPLFLPRTHSIASMQSSVKLRLPCSVRRAVLRLKLNKPTLLLFFGKHARTKGTGNWSEHAQTTSKS